MNRFPYTNFHDINMDWIIKTLKDVLYKLEHLPSGGGGAVDSVNGYTGAVVLDASDVGALPDTYVPPTEIFWAEYNVTTNAEIEAAYQAGKLCVCVNPNTDRIYVLTFRDSATKHYFGGVQGNNIYMLRCESDTWYSTYRAVPNPSSVPPQPLGTAAVGTGTSYARNDHVHAMPSAANVGAIAAPASPAVGDFLIYTAQGWDAVTMAEWQGGNY